MARLGASEREHALLTVPHMAASIRNPNIGTATTEVKQREALAGSHRTGEASFCPFPRTTVH